MEYAKKSICSQGIIRSKTYRACRVLRNPGEFLLFRDAGKQLSGKENAILAIHQE